MNERVKLRLTDCTNNECTTIWTWKTLLELRQNKEKFEECLNFSKVSFLVSIKRDNYLLAKT